MLPVESFIFYIKLAVTHVQNSPQCIKNNFDQHLRFPSHEQLEHNDIRFSKIFQQLCDKLLNVTKDWNYYQTEVYQVKNMNMPV